MTCNAKARSLVTALLAGTAAMATSPALAQVTTSTIRGTVTDEEAPQGGVEVVARNASTGYTRRYTTGSGGSFVLSGLRPGTYTVTATAPDGSEAQASIRAQVGQNLRLNLELEPAGAAADTEDVIVVTGRPVGEFNTSEIGTNVSMEQIELLPQGTRNFLNFAQLAPGVRLSRDEFRQQFSGGATNAEGDSLAAGQVNVFIDGVSLKSNIQQGGIVGQDASRGNPFGQVSVQEFRVITQNFKAEYEQAGSSIITAITRSGTNEFEGEVFGLYSDRELIARDGLTDPDEEKPEFSRQQYGGAFGGPIVEDKLFFFLSYEANDQDRTERVEAGNPELHDELPFDVADYEGNFDSPFREDLYFGKLTWQIDGRQFLEGSVSVRQEEDIRSFGGQTSHEGAGSIENTVTTVQLKHQFEGDGWLNELSFNYLESNFSPSPLNPDLIGQEYRGVITIGGGATIQDVTQRGYTLRDNLTFNDIQWRGEHVVKMGVKLSYQEAELLWDQFGNPRFTYIDDPAQNLDFSFPAEARYGIGDPFLAADNYQVGVFIQDDWDITDRLTLNLGIRWDMETNANNKDFVTPDEAVEALRYLEDQLAGTGSSFRADDYISTGDNRDPYMGAFGPRLGFSYDLFGTGDTILFGGAGRFYDRTLFRNAGEEALLREFELRTFYFSQDGSPRPDGQETIEWDPSYLSQEGLDGLIESGVAPEQELRVLLNDQRPPSSDQYSIGVRQRIGQFNTSLAYSYIEGRNDIAYFPANRVPGYNEDGFIDVIDVPNYGTVVASTDARATRFEAIYVTVDKPYTEESGWGLNIAYTLADAEERGFLFNFDQPDVANADFVPNAADETHRLVVSGMVDLLWGLRLSTLATFASGQPFNVVDNSAGDNPRDRVIGHFGDAEDFAQVDLRLQKEIDSFGDQTAIFFVEALNVFNEDNYGGYDGFIPAPPNVNENFGQPNRLAGPPRTVQFGFRYTF